MTIHNQVYTCYVSVSVCDLITPATFKNFSCLIYINGSAIVALLMYYIIVLTLELCT